ncbi:MAG: InlB B-repeat-containing protein [Candidatus Bathyarchaeales archaeon]
MRLIAKFATIVLLVLLASTISVPLVATVTAQTTDAQVVITVTPQEGGTTDPEPGTYNYPEGTIVLLTAKPSAGYKFSHWIIQGGYITTPNRPPLILPREYVDPETGKLIIEPPPPVPPSTSSTFESLIVTQNPLVISCGYGYTYSYQAVFISTEPTDRPYAVVVVKESAGGKTDPSAGTYTFAEGSSITLKAIPDEGYEFKYWLVTGTGSMGHPLIFADNPLTPSCGIGYTYEYQPIFVPVGAAAEGIPREYLYIIIGVLVVIAIIAIAVALVRGRKK